MNACRLLLLIIWGGIAASALTGCKSTGESRSDADQTTQRTFNGETTVYRVEVTQHEREGRCVRRDVLFRSHSRLYLDPHVDRARAIDIGCDAIYVSDFERFSVMRSPTQQNQYTSNFSFRRQIDEDLWDAYQHALFDDEVARRRARASDSGRETGN